MKWDTFKPSLLSVLVFLHIFILFLALLILVRQKGHPHPDKDRIVVLPIEGLITLNSDHLVGAMSVDHIVKKLEAARDDKTVKAIVLRINSPGGSVGAVQEIHRAVLKLKEKKKIVVSSFGDVSASGGYYIACAGDHIVSNPGTITGSIGVIMQIPNVQNLLKKVGVGFEVIKSGQFKDAASPFRDMSKEEKALFQELLLDAYDQFYQAVKEGRKLSDEALKTLADGRVFSGRLALKKKLVDELGGLEEAVQKAKELSGLKDKKPQIIIEEEKPSFEKLLRLFTRSSADQLLTIAEPQAKLMYLLQ